MLRAVRPGAAVRAAAAAHGAGAAAGVPLAGRGLPARTARRCARRHAADRHQRDAVRHARRAVPGAGHQALPRRLGNVRPAHGRAGGWRHGGGGDQRLDRPGQPSRPGGDLGRPAVGRCGRRLRADPQLADRAAVPRAGRRQRHDLRDPAQRAAADLRAGTAAGAAEQPLPRAGQHRPRARQHRGRDRGPAVLAHDLRGQRRPGLRRRRAPARRADPVAAQRDPGRPGRGRARPRPRRLTCCPGCGRRRRPAPSCAGRRPGSCPSGSSRRRTPPRPPGRR